MLILEESKSEVAGTVGGQAGLTSKGLVGDVVLRTARDTLPACIMVDRALTDAHLVGCSSVEWGWACLTASGRLGVGPHVTRTLYQAVRQIEVVVCHTCQAVGGV